MSAPEELRSVELARADLLLTVATLFAPPTAHTATVLRAIDQDELASLLRVADLPGRAGATLAELTVLAGEHTEAWSEEHARLFEGAGSGRANETNYVRRDRGAILGDIAGFYSAFGVEPRDTAGERVDHIAAELEFLAFLLVMEANARSADPDGAGVAADAIGRFLADHLGLWVAPLRAEIDRVLPGLLFSQLAAFTVELCEGIARSYGVEVAQAVDASMPDGAAPFECGATEKRTAGFSGSEHVINPGVD